MPLRPVEFHILLALAAEERHGYGLLQEVANLTEGELQLEPGTLYRALHRLLKDGWVRIRPPSGRGSGRRAATVLPADAGRAPRRVG